MSVKSSSIYSPLAAESTAIQGLRNLVKDAGGEWIGVQTDIEYNTATLVFRVPGTKKSLHVPFHPVDFSASELFLAVEERVKKETAEDPGQKVSVAILKLQDIANTLRSISQELDALCARRKE